jgi:hypothetical protein
MSAHAGQWRRPRTPSYSTVPVINQSPRFCFSFERSFSYHQMQKTYACLWKSCRCVTVEPKHLSRGSPQHSALLQSPQHDGARWFLPFVDDCPLCGLLGLGVTECGLGIRLLSGHMMFSDSFILPYSFWLNSVVLCGCSSLSVHLPTGKHLGCFQLQIQLELACPPWCSVDLSSNFSSESYRVSEWAHTLFLSNSSHFWKWLRQLHPC